MTALKQLKRSEVEEEFFGCPYCGNTKDRDNVFCCGENHNTDLVATKDGEVFGKCEVEIQEKL